MENLTEKLGKHSLILLFKDNFLCFCGDLDENSPHRLMCLSMWSLGDGTVQEGLEGVVLLEGIHHWGEALRFQKTLVCSLPPVVDQT